MGASMGRASMGALVLVGATLTVPLLSGCGTDTGSAGGSEAPGEVLIGLTDADGDFITYQVDVNSLTLTRADGLVVEVLPLSTRVDFAQYTEMTEFLTAAMVPGGVYVQGEMTLDYSTADVQVEVNGAPVPVTLLDADGNALTGPLTMAVHLEDRNQLRIRPGIPAHVVFDFELAATHQVDLSDPTLPVVSVDPVLLAEVDRDFVKPHRLRGLLKDVVVDESVFHLYTRPFRHRDAVGTAGTGALSDSLSGPPSGDLIHHPFGQLAVRVTADTEYDIDGIAYTGHAGLVALAAKPARTPVVALGHIKRAERHLVAKRVRAGDSVPWGRKDVVRGVVVQRSGDTLTVRGAALSFADGRACRDHFRRFVEVQLDPNATRVTAPGLGGVGTDALSIGQRITAVGTLNPNLTCVAGDVPVIQVIPVLAADAVRMHITALTGTVVALPFALPAADALADASLLAPRELVVSLLGLGGVRPADLDFTGTGIDPAHDADPLNYQIDVGLLNVAAMTVGETVRVRGLVTPFGHAPADFTSRSLFLPPVEPDVKGMIQVVWQPPTDHPLDAIDDTGLTLDLASADLRRHHLVLRGEVIDLTTLAGPVRVAPGTTGEGRFAILGAGAHLFRDYARFATTLESLLVDAHTVRHITAHGAWDDASQTLTVGTLTVVMGRGIDGPIRVFPAPRVPGSGVDSQR